NRALIAIGVRNESLERQAIETARVIGKVEVDHGETSCKTPDAEAYIKKTKERAEKKKVK
ncbi:DNA alkylation repair protein, partial [Bacillus mobilis]